MYINTCVKNTWFSTTKAHFNTSLTFPQLIFQQGAYAPQALLKTAYVHNLQLHTYIYVCQQYMHK